MNIALVTLFPEMLSAITEYGISGRAIRQGLVRVECFNPRNFTEDRHQTVDDRPYGGGPGMVMLIEPLRRAVQQAREWLDAVEEGDKSITRVVYLSPQGRLVRQEMIDSQAESNANLILIAGRYEGVDERLVELEVDEEWSIGDYVLSGGELPAMVLIDALIRKLPGALGHQDSAEQDSFSGNLLDCPHYTRPENYSGLEVPEVLLSGNHERIRRWRLEQALGRTWQRRPDLLQGVTLDDEQQELLAEYRRKLANEGDR